MKLLITLIVVFSLTAFPQNIKKIKLFIDNNIDLQKAYSLDIDHEHFFKEKDDGIILYVL